MSDNKTWLLKHKNDRIEGPLSVDEILQLIKDKIIKGEESIALYPSDRWTSISVEPIFYEAFMASLTQTLPKKKSHNFTPVTVEYDGSDSPDTVLSDMNELHSMHKKKQARKKQKRGEQKKEIVSAETVFYQIPEEEIQRIDGISDREESGIKSFFSKKKNIICFGITIILVSVIFIMLNNQNNLQVQNEYIEFQKPRKNQPAISTKQSEILINKGLYLYLKDTIATYIKAQTLLVKAIEGNPKDTYAMGILCLVYLELWPFTKQDYKSARTISFLIQKTSILDKGGVRSGLCYSVGLFIRGKYADAKLMVESSLDGLNESMQDTQAQKIIPLFYYLKTRALYYLNNYIIMMSYLDSLQKSVPRWIAPYMLTANVLLKTNKPAQALGIYKKVLKLNPKHKIAKIKLGLIEYKYFKKIKKAENILNIALQYPGIIPYHIFSQAYFVLAKINLTKGDRPKALKYARLSYSYDPSNDFSKQLVIKLGGIKKLKQTRVKSRQLIYKADQLVLDNKFQEAIIYYEEAFKIDNQRNAQVAIKIAKNYWTLSFFDQSIKWLKTAININTFIIEAYMLMAKYYIERYDFHNAEKIFRIASQKAPRSYELYRGKANLALKKDNYNMVIKYAQTALSIYEADIESHVMLSQAYAKLGHLNESLASATRGLEIDPNSIKTQVAYAKALGWVYDVDTGGHYFQKLINNYPLIIGYRMEWMKYLFQDEQYHRAQQEVSVIIKEQPSYKEAFFYLGRILMLNNDFTGAYEAFLQASIVDPFTPSPTFYIGLLRLKEKRYSLAKKQFIKVLALNKFYPKAHYYLGEIAFLQKKYETAIKEARLEIQLSPYLLLPYRLVGRSYEQLKQFLNCAGEYQKAIEIFPNNVDIYVKIARCYRKSGHLDLAVKILKKGGGGDNTTMHSGDPQLYKELGIIYEIKQFYPAAIGSYCNYLNLVPKAPDRWIIKKRMKKIYQLTKIKVRDCG